MPILSVHNSTSATEAKPKSTTDNRLGMGKDEFLQLFVKRLQNQDPLSPMQDEDFIAQMAQFSSLEQLSNMNENLQKALSGNGLLSQTISNTMAASLIGRSVRVESSSTVLGDSGGADIRYDLESAAADVQIEIKNKEGVLVRALRPGASPSGTNTVAWDGKDANGTRMPKGAYEITVRATDEKGDAIGAKGYYAGKVSGVRYVDGNAMLVVNSALIPLANVMEVLAGDGG